MDDEVAALRASLQQKLQTLAELRGELEEARLERDDIRVERDRYMRRCKQLQDRLDTIRQVVVG